MRYLITSSLCLALFIVSEASNQRLSSALRATRLAFNPTFEQKDTQSQSWVSRPVSLLQEAVREATTEDQPGGDEQAGLAAGTPVAIDGLQSAVELNGQTGVIQGFDESSGRYVVRLAHGGRPKKVRAEHLQPLGPPQPSGEALQPEQMQESSQSQDGQPQDGQPEEPEAAPQRSDAAGLLSALFGGAGAAGPRQDQESQQEAQGGQDNEDILPRGTHVVMGGLLHMQELNGRLGVIQGFDQNSGRYVVQIPGSKPRRIKPSNLQPVDQPHQASDDSNSSAKSICKRQATHDHNQLRPGTKVLVHGLTSKAALQGGWNGMIGTVHCYDNSTERFVVAMPDGTPRKIRLKNLAVMNGKAVHPAQLDVAPSSLPAPPAIETTTTPPPPVHWQTGSKARIVNLKNAIMLNGQVARVQSFDNTTDRYIVQVPDGSLKRIKADNLAPVQPAGESEFAGGQGGAVRPLLTVCNAYPEHLPLQVFELSGDESAYSQVVRNLEFQTCIDITRLHHKTRWLSFVVGRLQVARIAVNSTEWTQRHGLELVVFRANPNSLKAGVHKNEVSLTDAGAYYLHVVNGYSGAKSLELHVERGNYKKKIPLDSTYRLTHEQTITLSLSDGFEKLELGFEPRKSRTYCIVATGADQGLKGEPKNVGLVAHEIGTWTTFEEMAGEGASSMQPEGEPPVLPIGEPSSKDKEQTESESSHQGKLAEDAPNHYSSYYGFAALSLVAFVSFFLYGYMTSVARSMKLDADFGE